jgi:hypothetical protein
VIAFPAIATLNCLNHTSCAHCDQVEAHITCNTTSLLLLLLLCIGQHFSCGRIASL